MGLIRVLILEDDEDIIDLIRSILEPAYDCFSAANGMEGLQQALEGEPDFIICDIMMPVMDGWEFIRRLRAMPGFETIPVIFLSALSSQERIKEGYRLGATLYLTKPIEPARLRRNLDLFIRDHAITPRPKKRRSDELKAYSMKTGDSLILELTAPKAPQPAPAKAPTPAVPAPAPVKPTAPSPAPAAASPPRDPQKKEDTTGLGKKEEDTIGPKKKDEPGARKKMFPPPMPVSTPSDRVRIMVVDDDRDTCQMLHAALVEEYEVMETSDGISAIERSVRYKPDIFIIDGMLPRMTGYQLTMMLRKNRDFYRSPIIFISGKATPRDQQYAQSLGISHFMAKPFTAKQMTKLLAEIIAKPDFAIRKDRIDMKQVFLEQFQHIEVNRSTHNTLVDSAGDLERKHLENVLKKQLQ